MSVATVLTNPISATAVLLAVGIAVASISARGRLALLVAISSGGGRPIEGRLRSPAR